MSWRHVLLILTLGAAAVFPASWGWRFDLPQTYLNLTAGVGPYEAYLSLFAPLTANPDPPIESDQEAHLYWNMFKRSFLPQYGLVQVSGYPLLNLSAYSEAYWPRFYSKLTLDSSDPNSNLLRIISSGETAPYALSAFLGNIQGFWEMDSATEEPRQCGSAIMGFVFSYANKSIYPNSYIRDHWLEIKWKLKGNRIKELESYSWNLQGGFVFHHLGYSTGPLQHALVGSLERTRTDRGRGISLLYNSTLYGGFEAPVFSENIHHVKDILANFLFKAGLAYPIKKKVVVWLIGGFRYTSVWDPAANGFARDLQYIIKPNVDF